MKLSRKATLSPCSTQIPPMQIISRPSSVLTTRITMLKRLPIRSSPRDPVFLSAEQVPRGLRHVRLPHQALADEEASHARGGKSLAIGMTGDAAFGHQQRTFGREESE